MAHRKSWSMETPVVLDGGPLGVADVVAVARRGAPVALGLEARRRLEAARAVVEAVIARGEVVYGVNTGFGELSRVHISDADLATLQQNLLRSHAAGVGEPLPDEVVRGMLLLLAASQARGHSGVRPVVPELVVEMLNRGVTPVVPARGSLGASGDLAPLAHIGLVLIGEGEATLDGERLPGRAALERAGLPRCARAGRERRGGCRDVAGSATRHRRALRRAHSGCTPSGRPGRDGGAYAGAACRQRHHSQPPH